MKAQLIIVGGRAPIPNMLTIIHQRPDVIIAVCSTESKNDLPRLEQAIKAVYPACQIEQTDPVDAFSFTQIYSVCERAVKKYSETEWIFNITAGTTIMSIAAYEVAKTYQQALSIQCWYINTSQTLVISLLEGEFQRDNKENIFQITASDYAAAYNRELLPGELDDEREYVELNWLPFAERLGKSPHDASLIKLITSKVGDNKPGKDKNGEDKSKYFKMNKLSEQMYALLEEAQNLQIFSELAKDETSICFRLSYYQWKFLNGAWLEAYVWNEARKLAILDDSQWNHSIIDGKSKNELDVVMTYKAQLLVVECKTGEEVFDSETLYKLDSVANLLGGRFVSKILVTSLPLPIKEDKRQKFIEQVESRKIVAVTAENLPRISEILSEEATTPKYARI